MVRISTKLKVPVIGLTGAGTGMALGTLAAEYTSRATGQTAWNAFLVKGGVKGGIGLVTVLAADKLGAGSPNAGFFVETFAYGCMGSIFMDLAIALYPGGIPGLAEDWAMTSRVMAAGGRRVVKELGVLERRIPPAGSRAAPIITNQTKRWY